MKLKVSYGLTINKGNYESERIEVSEEYDVDENNIHVPDLRDDIFEDLKEWVHKKGGKL